jgi:hypothetical protein
MVKHYWWMKQRQLILQSTSNATNGSISIAEFTVGVSLEMTGLRRLLVVTHYQLAIFLVMLSTSVME